MDQVTIVDWIIIGIVVISMLISIKRGFVKEALSLASLVAAVVVASVFGPSAADLLTDQVETHSVRLLVAYSGIFVVTLIVGALINNLISHLVTVAGLTGTDRLLGMLFGFARGAVIVVILAGVMNLMPVHEDEWWQQSILIPRLTLASSWLQVTLFGSEVEVPEIPGLSISGGA
ncbi:MAG: colicin V production CvpA [Gammaproteobacteria bacterium]|nr:colicin V production CvpA [Gammaproteobacteria bacterium]RPG25100.1 MAG: CvpA family protein [Gammaproteobacteria bacterium TMED50]